MGDQVERALEETVPLLRQVRKLKLLSASEIESNVRKRRDHEYALRRPAATRSEFLKYAAFERETAEVFKTRAEARNLPEKRARSITAQQSARVNLVYSRAIRKFKGDDALYLHYARHCISTGSRKAAEKVLARAIAHRGDSEKVWLAAAAFHFDACGDIKVARAISQRGLRALKTSKRLWREYFRMELAYLAKLVARRTTIGMTVPESAIEGSGGAAEGEEVNNDTIQPTPAPDTAKLAFWDGGVPYAVFRSALDKARLDAIDAGSYLQLAASMPFAPLPLLKRLASDISARFDASANPYVKALLLRNSFDVASARLRQKRADMDACRDDKKDAQESIAEECVAADLTSNVARLAEQFVADLEALDKFGEEKRTSHAAVTEVLDDFLLRFKDCTQELAVVKKLETLCESLKSKSERQTRDGVEHVVSALLLADVSSAEEWALFLANNNEQLLMEGDPEQVDIIRAALLKATVLPFRTKEQEKICVLWFQWERDDHKLREAYRSVMSMPPASLVILQGAASAELELAGPNAASAVPFVRKLFSQASLLSDVKSDVEFWLAYFCFERDTAGDAAMASRVSWSAKRSMDASRATLFEERCTLLNLR